MAKDQYIARLRAVPLFASLSKRGWSFCSSRLITCGIHRGTA